MNLPHLEGTQSFSPVPSPGQRLLFTSLFVSGGGLEALTTAIECKDAPMRCRDQIIEIPFKWDVDICTSAYEL